MQLHRPGSTGSDAAHPSPKCGCRKGKSKGFPTAQPVYDSRESGTGRAHVSGRSTLAEAASAA